MKKKPTKKKGLPPDAGIMLLYAIFLCLALAAGALYITH